MKQVIEVDGKEVEITNPDKLMWPEYGVRKLDLIRYYVEVAPCLLPYVKDRLLTTIRYPDGVGGKFFYQKNKPPHAPGWLHTFVHSDTEYILANDSATLVYLGNQACLELHVSFHRIPGESPAELVFDLDPSTGEFEKAAECALRIKEELDQLRLPSCVKTSGATGLQIYIPIKAGHTFEETRRFGAFFSRYMAERHPRLVTVRRRVNERGDKVYFDYLQHWRGKSIIAPYSPRARKAPLVSAPLRWQEVPLCSPEDFTIFTIRDRIREVGDLFRPLREGQRADLDPILSRIPPSFG